MERHPDNFHKLLLANDLPRAKAFTERGENSFRCTINESDANGRRSVGGVVELVQIEKGKKK